MPNGCAAGCLALIVAAVVLAVIGVIAGLNSSTGVPQDFSAESACNDFVRSRLKSPATAHFNADTTTNVGSTYTVSGTVDSANGFGAQLRSSFTCTMTDTGDKWHLVNLEFVDGGDVN
jgi:hypothetical protein